MSSDEQDVAELAKAINSHADVLYESWKINNNVEARRVETPLPLPVTVEDRPLYDIVALKRMEDTLQLLADPAITPKLEHLVTNFVKRDKAKRQQQNVPQSATMSSSNSRRSSSPIKIIPIQKENGTMGSSNINNSNSPKKTLPKSIQAAVQRFEPGEIAGQELEIASAKISHNQPPGVNFPGIGTVTRDVLKTESNLSNRVSETSFRLNSPVRTTLGNNNNNSEERNIYENSSARNLNGGRASSPLNYFYERQLHKSNSNKSINTPNAREIHIPIERIDENGARTKIIDPSTRSPTSVFKSGVVSDDLQREEEKLVRALKTGQVINSPSKGNLQQKPKSQFNYISTEHRGHSPVHHHRIEHEETPTTTVDGISSITNNNDNPINIHNLHGNNNMNSHIAFAKERIRHSQEHPLTQQRLELQKQLPSPSVSLAAAIAVQQGKIKFQPSTNTQHQSHPPREEYHHHHHPRTVEHQHSRESNNDRQNWVSSMIKFGPGGSSSVAERVQLFEKYPPHIPMVMGNQTSQPSSNKDQVEYYNNNSEASSKNEGRTTSRSVINHEIKREQPINITSQRHLNNNLNHVYYSSPSPAISIPSHSPNEIQHTIRRAPDLFVTTPKVQPTQSDLHVNSSKGIDLLKSNAQDDRANPPGAAAMHPWRHNTSANTQRDELLQTKSQVIKPDAFSGQKKYKFGGRIPTRGSLGSDNSIIGDNKQISLPRFYWAEGKLPPSSYVEDVMLKAQQEYTKLKVKTPIITQVEFGQFLTAIGIPLYWKKPFWIALGQMADNHLDFETFSKFFRRLISECPDDASRFIRILWTQSKMISYNINNNNNNAERKNISHSHCDYSQSSIPEKGANLDLGMSDFIPMIQDIIDTHPGLGFLRDAPEFHSRYVTTVVSRIFYNVNRSWTGRITLAELRRSNVLSVIKRLEEETDVNNITEYFSYEHFYVIYCKFWELDKDHDLLIDKTDLASHSDHALSSRIVDRIFSGAVIRGWDMTSPTKCSPGKMTYSDFVWFLISEEDKKTPTAIEYWFRCLDIDGDGVLSPYELQHFYSEQERRIECLGIEPLDFSNIYCQIIDMLRCSPTGVRLKDLKKNPQLASNIFNTLFNLDKYLDHEQRDPFSAAGSGPYSVGDSGSVNGETESDWDKYAAAEYDLLIAEESPSDTVHETVSDFEESPGSYVP